MRFLNAVTLALGVTAATATTHFKEEFEDGYESRWTEATSKVAEGSQGTWAHSAGEYYNDAEKDKGLQTTTDARFYGNTAEFPEFDNEGKDLVIQYQVKHEQKIDCGGGYVKLLPGSVTDVANLNTDTPYNIMFGPDICGSTKRVHVIFNYKGENYLINKEIRCETDTKTHLYTLIVHPDNTYEVQIDQKEVAAGSLKEDWDMIPDKQIKDPEASKPSDWVDDAKIADPEDVKPEGYDDIEPQISDPEASKPEDWDDELDGEWEAPMIDNPEYKGPWKPRMIDNPDYVGEWVHPLVDNPDYFDDDTLYHYPSSKYIAFDLWQVKSGTVFDNIIITDSVEEAKAFAEETYVKTIAGEEAARTEGEKKKAEAEAAERAAREAEEDLEDDEDFEDDDNAKDEL